MRMQGRKRSVLQIDPKTNKIIRRFDSLTDAAISVGAAVTNIYASATKRKWKTKGFCWQYVDENPYFCFLEKLRHSGAINMYEAIPYLQGAFDISFDDAKDALIAWMENYDRNDYIGI